MPHKSKKPGDTAAGAPLPEALSSGPIDNYCLICYVYIEEKILDIQDPIQQLSLSLVGSFSEDRHNIYIRHKAALCYVT